LDCMGLQKLASRILVGLQTALAFNQLIESRGHQILYNLISRGNPACTHQKTIPSFLVTQQSQKSKRWGHFGNFIAYFNFYSTISRPKQPPPQFL
jgi:hypothetical protein